MSSIPDLMSEIPFISREIVKRQSWANTACSFRWRAHSLIRWPYILSMLLKRYRLIGIAAYRKKHRANLIENVMDWALRRSKNTQIHHNYQNVQTKFPFRALGTGNYDHSHDAAKCPKNDDLPHEKLVGSYIIKIYLIIYARTYHRPMIFR